MFTMVPYRRYLTKPTQPSLMNDPFFRSFFSTAESLAPSTFRVDIRELENEFVIQAELPGLNEENINLEVDENMLTISADFQNESKQEEGGRVYTERRSGHMERSFNLDNIHAEAISANYKNGILSVTLPKEKPVEKTARRIPILMEDNAKDKE